VYACVNGVELQPMLGAKSGGTGLSEYGRVNLLSRQLVGQLLVNCCMNCEGKSTAHRDYRKKTLSLNSIGSYTCREQ